MKISASRLRKAIISTAALLITATALSSCGSIHTFGGIEHDYSYDFDGHHHHHKHKKAKKHHKKHHHHHHHHDDD